MKPPPRWTWRSESGPRHGDPLRRLRVPACSVVLEAVFALELARAFLEKFPGDSIREARAAFGKFHAKMINFYFSL